MPPPMHRFAYGTLMFPEVWRRIVGRAFAAQIATATGFTIYRVRNGVYPVMVHSDSSERVAGVVYRDLDQATFDALDAYESNLYQRIAIQTTLDSGDALTCHAYVLPNSRARHASDERWDVAEFERHCLATYLEQLD